MSTFAPLVEPLGVPLRGDGRVPYLGAFYAHPRRGVVDLERVRTPFLLELLGESRPAEFTELGCHPAPGDRRPRARATPAEREVELATLTEPDLRARIEALGLTLASYHDWRAAGLRRRPR